MLNAVTCISTETSPTLTPQEIEVLFQFSVQMADLGELSNGKYAGANRPLYWQRLKGNN